MLATQIVHWPGKDVPVCDDHRRKLIALASAMGFPVSCTPCVETICTNCQNEVERGTPKG